MELRWQGRSQRAPKLLLPRIVLISISKPEYSRRFRPKDDTTSLLLLWLSIESNHDIGSYGGAVAEGLSTADIYHNQLGRLKSEGS